MSSSTSSKALKRARQKEARNIKRAAEQKVRKRRASIRRFSTIGAIIVIGLGVYAASGGFSSPAKKPAAKTTRAKTTAKTSTSTSTSTSAFAKAQAAADKIAVKAGCPSNPHTPLKKKLYSSPPPMTINPSKTYTAVVTTDVGTFDIALNPKEAPKTVNNFVFLANHHFYNCIIFQRVIPGFMNQTGDPTGTGTGGPGYSYTGGLPPKASAGKPQYPIGSVAMANSGTTSSNGSQFFIVTGTQGESLPPNYTLFGQVTSGMSVVQKINSQGNSSPSANGVPPLVIHRMLSVTIKP
ncbi:MAG: peptidylprolyl isomerase [Acidimicrobiales bacterium]